MKDSWKIWQLASGMAKDYLDAGIEPDVDAFSDIAMAEPKESVTVRPTDSPVVDLDYAVQHVGPSTEPVIVTPEEGSSLRNIEQHMDSVPFKPMESFSDFIVKNFEGPQLTNLRASGAWPSVADEAKTIAALAISMPYVPFERFVERPAATLATDIQNLDVGWDTLKKMGRSPIAEAYGEDAKTFGDIWGNYYEDITGEAAPEWYKGMAGLATAQVALSIPAISKIPSKEVQFRKIFQTFSKQEKFIPAQNIKLSAEQFRNLPEAAKLNMLRDVYPEGKNLPAGEVRRMMKEGVDVEIPAQKIITSGWVDRPWWKETREYLKSQRGFYAGPGAKGYAKGKNKFSSTIDRKIRFEIDTSKAKVDRTNIPVISRDVDMNYHAPTMHMVHSFGASTLGAPLQSVFKLPELYKNYPILKEFTVYAVDSPDTLASANKRNRVIKVNRNFLYNPDLWTHGVILKPDGTKQNIKFSDLDNNKKVQFVLMHEIQHFIQDMEGFSSGGNPADWKDMDPDIARDAYWRLGGEVEARDVAARMNLTPEQRIKIQPMSSQGIPRSEIIDKRKLKDRTSGQHVPLAIVQPPAEVPPSPTAISAYSAMKLTKQMEQSQSIPPADVKPLVQQVTGVKVGDIVEVSERDLLKIKLSAEEKATREAYKAGKQEGLDRLEDYRGKIKLYNRIQRAMHRIESNPKHPDKSIDFAYMERINDARNAVEFTNPGFKEMTVEQLEALGNEVRQLKREGRMVFIRKKRIARLEHEVIRNKLVSTLGEKPNVGPVTEESTAQTEGQKFIGQLARTYRPLRLFDLLDQGKDYKGNWSNFFYWNNDKAANTEITETLNRYDAVDKAFKESNVQGKSPAEWAIQRTSVINPATNKPFTKQEAMHAYYALQNDEMYDATRFGNRLSEDTIQKLADSLNASERAFADKFMAIEGSSYERLRQLSIDNYNKDLPRVKNYHRMMRQMEFSSAIQEMDEEALLRQVYGKRGAEKGFMEKRVNISPANQKPVNMNAFEVGMQAIQSQEHLIAYAPLQKKWIRMINDSKFQEALQRRLGIAGYKTVKKWVEDSLNPRSVYNSVEPFWTAIRRNASVAMLGYNVVSTMVQSAALPLVLPYTTPVDLMTSAVDVVNNYEKVKNFVMERDPQVRQRAIERDMEELMRSKNKSKLIQLRNKLGESAFKGIFYVDRMSVLIAWNAAYKTAKAKGMSEAEAIEHAHKAFINTQTQAHVKDLPDIYRSGELLKAATQFTNDLNTTFNILIHDIGYNAKQGKNPKHVINSIVGVLLSSGIAWIIRNGGRLPDDFNDFFDATFGQAVSSIPVFGNVIYNTATGYDYSLPVLEPFKAASQGKFVKAGATAFGIPYAQPARTLKGIGDLATGKSSDPRRLLFSAKALEEDEKKKEEKEKKNPYKKRSYRNVYKNPYK